MLHSSPRGLTRDDVFQAHADSGAGIDHPLGAPTGHEAVHGGKCHPPQVVVGPACPTSPVGECYSSSTTRSSLGLDSFSVGCGESSNGVNSSGGLARFLPGSSAEETSPPRLSRRNAPPWFSDRSE
jgi:hypothetical protein